MLPLVRQHQNMPPQFGEALTKQQLASRVSDAGPNVSYNVVADLHFLQQVTVAWHF
jgi:hypothetical protein